jgi:hypothetical protein
MPQTQINQEEEQTASTRHLRTGDLKGCGHYRNQLQTLDNFLFYSAWPRAHCVPGTWQEPWLYLRLCPWQGEAQAAISIAAEGQLAGT